MEVKSNCDKCGSVNYLNGERMLVMQAWDVERKHINVRDLMREIDVIRDKAFRRVEGKALYDEKGNILIKALTLNKRYAIL